MREFYRTEQDKRKLRLIKRLLLFVKRHPSEIAWHQYSIWVSRIVINDCLVWNKITKLVAYINDVLPSQVGEQCMAQFRISLFTKAFSQ